MFMHLNDSILCDVIFVCDFRFEMKTKRSYFPFYEIMKWRYDLMARKIKFLLACRRWLELRTQNTFKDH